MKLEEHYLHAPTTSGGSILLCGFMVPGTNLIMFVHRRKDRTWGITHVPTRRRVMWVRTRAEALEYAKAFYDAAVSEQLKIDSKDQVDLSDWIPAIEKHVPRFGPPSVTVT